MRKLMLILATATAPLLAAGAALAQATDGQTASPLPGATVRGHQRTVCRVVRRTATRMRTGRICQTVTQGPGQQSGDRIADAADTLDTQTEAISTGDVGGSHYGDRGLDTEPVVPHR